MSIKNDLTGRLKLHFNRLGCRWLLPVMIAAGLFNCSAEPEEKWIDLFNGENLDGWVVKIAGHELGQNPGNIFRVEDGLLKVSYDHVEKFDNTFGHIFYDQSFSHYVLKLDYRFVGEQCPGGPEWAFRNSGAMLHCQTPQSMAVDQNFPVCIEVQFLGGNGVDPRSTANLCTPGTHVMMGDSLVTRHCINSSSETYHGDQWVSVQVEVHGDSLIRHLVNGQRVLEYTRPQLDENDAHAAALMAGGDKRVRQGYISLQAESHEVHFRNIQVRVLEP